MHTCTPLIDVSGGAYAFRERVPLFIYAVDKIGVSGSLLQGKIGSELVHVCEKKSDH